MEYLSPKVIATKGNKKGDVIYEGWYFFPDITVPLLTKVIYEGKQITKNVGTYHKFLFVSNCGKYQEEKLIYRPKPYNEVSTLSLDISPFYGISRGRRIDVIQKQIYNHKREIKSHTKALNKLEKEMEELQAYTNNINRRSALVVVTGWLGDALFSIPIAQKLKQQKDYYRVDYLIGFNQPKKLMENDVYVDDVFVFPNPTPYPDHTKLTKQHRYDDIFILPTNDLSDLPTIKFQKACGIEMTSTEFYTRLPSEYDKKGFAYKFPRPKIGICATWKDKHEKLRDISKIMIPLQEYFPEFDFVKIGSGISQFDGTSVEEVKNFYKMLGLMKKCDFIIGCEGGLLNFASSLKVRTICATDFTVALFGENGRMYQYKDWDKRITPKAFFPNDNHINLSPDIDTEEKIVEAVKNILLDSFEIKEE